MLYKKSVTIERAGVKLISNRLSTTRSGVLFSHFAPFKLEKSGWQNSNAEYYLFWTLSIMPIFTNRVNNLKYWVPEVFNKNEVPYFSMARRSTLANLTRNHFIFRINKDNSKIQISGKRERKYKVFERVKTCVQYIC